MLNCETQFVVESAQMASSFKLYDLSYGTND
jgi:hypothetical protein